MKKLIYSSLILALVGIGVIGCKKQNVDKSVTKGTSKSETLPIKSAGVVTSQNGILQFDNWENATQFMNEVVENQEIHVEEFYENYNDFSEDEIDSIIDTLNWEYNQPYIDVEQEYNIKTLLTFVDDKLYKDDLSEEERSYWDKYLVEDDFGAILNSDAIVSVGDSIYKFLQNMSVIASTFNSLELVKSINDDNIEDFLDNENLKVHGYTPKNSSSCRSNRQVYDHVWWNPGGGSRTMKGWLVVRNFATGSGGFSIRYVRAKTKTERYRWGKNRRWRATISAATFGTIFRNRQPWRCQGNSEACNTSRQRWNHKVKSTYKNQSIWQLLLFRARAGEVKSIHLAPGRYLEIWLD